MKTKLTTSVLFVLSVLFVASPVLHADTLKLKLSQVLTLAGDQSLGITGALPQLEGQPQPIAQGKDADGHELPPKILLKPYEFSGKIRWAIAKNLLALQEQVKIFETARASLIKEAAAGAEAIKPDDAAALAKFTTGFNELMAQEVKVDLTKLTQDDLKLDVNQIPLGVLTALQPILSEK